MEGTTYGQNGQGIPVLTYEEMAGLVLGYDPWDLGMQMHQVAVEPLLEKMGVPLRPVDKISRQKRQIHRPAGTDGNRLLPKIKITHRILTYMGNRVIIIGGGVAGMQAAITLDELGLQPILIEKEAVLGGKLNKWDRLFPTMTPAEEVLTELTKKVQASNTEVHTSTAVGGIDDAGKSVTLADGTKIDGDAVVVASGYDIFPAEIKEEYGYGIYDNVFTTVDIERMFKEGGIRTADGKAPKSVAFLHCVGSRDEKVGQRHCSRVCCITGVKQAIEVRQALPETEVYSFYMDMRMFGPGYEELYKEAQQTYGIHFVRGRISEAAPTIDNRIQIKAEDTLIGRPLKMTVDMLVLIVGMKAGASNMALSRNRHVDLYPSGFVKPANQFTGNVASDCSRIYYAGAVTAPKNIGESINEGIAAAYKVAGQLKA